VASGEGSIAHPNLCSFFCECWVLVAVRLLNIEDFIPHMAIV
jgi:hypothetical protein